MHAFTNAFETGLGLDDRHNVGSKVKIHLKIKSKICQLIHDKSNDIYSIAIHHMRDYIPIKTSDLVLVPALRHESDSSNLFMTAG